MEKIRLLLVEDNEMQLFMVKGSLELMGNYEIHTAGNGKAGLKLYNEIHPDIIVADVEMPEMSGFEMVKVIRETDTHTPIIFASALKSSKDLIDGMSLGADNYIRKPFLPEELNLLITALLNRVKGPSVQSAKSKDQYTFGNYLLDTQSRLLKFQNDDSGNQLSLTEREVSILKILLERKHEVVRREEILNTLWGNNDYYTARSLDVFMTKIRKYLKEDSSIEIQTIRGEGYRVIINTTGRTDI